MQVKSTEDLIESLNNLKIKKEIKNSINEKNNYESDIEEEHISHKEDGSSENVSESEKIKDNSEDEIEIDNYKMSDLYDRLLKDNRFIKYKDLISNIKKRLKRKKCGEESDDEIKKIVKLNLYILKSNFI